MLPAGETKVPDSRVSRNRGVYRLQGMTKPRGCFGSRGFRLSVLTFYVSATSVAVFVAHRCRTAN
jgi:hypothetical protein